jgi:hypothetical protein
MVLPDNYGAACPGLTQRSGRHWACVARFVPSNIDPVRILARLQPTFLAGRSAVFVAHHHDE